MSEFQVGDVVRVRKPDRRSGALWRLTRVHGDVAYAAALKPVAEYKAGEESAFFTEALELAEVGGDAMAETEWEPKYAIGDELLVTDYGENEDGTVVKVEELPEQDGELYRTRQVSGEYWGNGQYLVFHEAQLKPQPEPYSPQLGDRVVTKLSPKGRKLSAKFIGVTGTVVNPSTSSNEVKIQPDPEFLLEHSNWTYLWLREGELELVERASPEEEEDEGPADVETALTFETLSEHERERHDRVARKLKVIEADLRSAVTELGPESYALSGRSYNALESALEVVLEEQGDLLQRSHEGF